MIWKFIHSYLKLEIKFELWRDKMGCFWNNGGIKWIIFEIMETKLNRRTCVSRIVDESDSKISHGLLQLHQQITVTGFGILQWRPTCWGSTLLLAVQVQTHLSKKYQMHVIIFCQDSILLFSDGRATPYPLGKWHVPISTIIKER